MGEVEASSGSPMDDWSSAKRVELAGCLGSGGPRLGHCVPRAGLWYTEKLGK